MPFALVWLLAGTANAQEDAIGLQSLFAAPGVRLVVVEFWADFCKPCVESLPKWKALHKKYRSRGFRLVMVAVSSEGRCAVPDWVPDRKVCDLTGEIAKSWFATELPQAFLWTWQGTLLLEHATFEEVEQQVQRWFEDAPRIMVQKGVDRQGRPLADGEELRRLVRSELGREGKFDLVADPKELDELRRLRRLGYQANYDESTQCRLGMDISPNSVLKIMRFGDRAGSERLLLELFSLEKGCLVASSVAPVGEGSQALSQAVIEATASLTREMVGDAQHPSKWEGPGGLSATSAESPRVVSNMFGSLTVRSSPSGAWVFVDGTPLGKTPMNGFRVPARKVQLRLVADNHHPDVLQDVNIAPGKEVVIDRQLRPRFGKLTVHAFGVGGERLQVPVAIDGAEAGVAPVEAEVAPGKHTVEVAGPEGPRTREVMVEEGQTLIVDVQVVGKGGATDVASPGQEGPGLVADEKAESPRVLPWVVAGLGVVTGAAGGTLLYMGQSRYERVEADSKELSQVDAQRSWDDADTLVRWGWITAGAGAAVAAGAIAWWALARNASDEGAGVSLRPSLHNGLFFTFEGRF